MPIAADSMQFVPLMLHGFSLPIIYGMNNLIADFVIQLYFDDCPNFTGSEEEIKDQRETEFTKRANEVKFVRVLFISISNV